MRQGVGGAVRQRTFKNAIHCSGITLHHGANVSMTLHPAPAGTGVRFRRSDIRGGDNVIPASWRNVAGTTMCTTLANADGASVATVEHLLAALSGCGIDNLLVELDGPEVPIMDGSAWPFVFLAECAGTVEQEAPRRAVRILKPVQVGDGERSARLEPGDGFSLSFEIAYEDAEIAPQTRVVRLANGSFKSEVSRARTFGFLREVDSLRAAGLARGASLDNAIVVGSRGVMNEGGLRYEDEFVRHKILDSIGDLYLAGGPILGHFHGSRSGHKLNHRLLRALFADPTAWEPADQRETVPLQPAATAAEEPQARFAAR